MKKICLKERIQQNLPLHFVPQSATVYYQERQSQIHSHQNLEEINITETIYPISYLII